MANYQNIEFEIKEDKGYLTLNRPEVRNAFNDKMIAEMQSVFETMRDLPEARALVIRGKGSVFSAGADLNWMQKGLQYSYEESRQASKKLQELFENLYQLPVPTISLIHGACFGGSLGLIAASDMVLAQHGTQFRFSEVRIGLIPATIAPYIMKRTGEYAAKYYMLTGKIFDVKNALRMGLVDFSGNEEHLYSELEHLLNELDKNSVQAVRQTKKLLHEISRSVNMNQIKNMTLDAIAKARISKDGQEGMKAFLEKRKPVWRKDRK